ncbi:uncharacterized protein LOC144742057, partial [Lampetra planeri]
MSIMSSSLVNSLAKVYDPNPLHGRKLSLNGSQASSSPHEAALRCMESRMDSLTSQMERLLNMQHVVLTRLDSLSQDVRGMGRDLTSMREEGAGGGGWGRRGSEVEAACRELRGSVERVSERMENQGRRLEGVEKLVEGTQQVLSYIGEVVKSSRLVELLFKQPGRKVKPKAKDDKDKTKVNLRSLKAQKKRKPSNTDSLKEPELQGDIEKLNRQNSDHSHGNTAADSQRAEDLILEAPDNLGEQKKTTKQSEHEEQGASFEHSHLEEGGEVKQKPAEQTGGGEDGGKQAEESPQSSSVISDVPAETRLLNQDSSSEEVGDVATCSKRRVTEEEPAKDDLKKSRVEDGEAAEGHEAPELRETKSDAAETDVDAEGEDGESVLKEFIIDFSPPPSAPFDHRIVTPKPHQIATYYTINRDEVLGGGRFGQVHKCTENSSGLTLAAKIIKAKSPKEKDVVRNEIQVMNQLNHSNLIQLYAAFESRHDIILVMEYVEGGELFDRIIDENYNLTELDTVLFIRQICEGLQYMHKMYILHLDLKPENILCVSRATNKIKIIDLRPARRYKPREKLRVNFGTPEFLAPEVINYEFVSFPTDMWSLGVITYMLLSGLSPFLGDDDNETLNNILACQWNFEEEEFSDISDEAKDFITRLLVKSKSWRMSATESLRHPWLSDRSLHYKLNLKKNKCHSTHSPCTESSTGREHYHTDGFGSATDVLRSMAQSSEVPSSGGGSPVNGELRRDRKVAVITGITGQDGSYLAEFLLAKGYEEHKPMTPFPDMKLHYGDLTDSTCLVKIINQVKPTEIYNLGAQSHVKTELRADVSPQRRPADNMSVWVLLSAAAGRRSDHSEGSSVSLLGRRRTGNSGQTLAGRRGKQLQNPETQQRSGWRSEFLMRAANGGSRSGTVGGLVVSGQTFTWDSDLPILKLSDISLPGNLCRGPGERL